MDELSFYKDEINKLWAEVKDLRKVQSDTSQAITEIKTDIKYIRKEFEEFTSALKELKSVPAARWNLIITAIITALTSGLVGAFISYAVRKG